MATRSGDSTERPLATWSPLPTRPVLAWPSNRPVALGVVVLVEHCQFPAPGSTLPSCLPGGFGTSWPHPNLPFFGQREYGHRVGIFRVLEAIRNAGARATVAIDAMSAELYPPLVAECHRAGAEIMCHGISVNQMISSALSEADERSLIGSARQRVKAATGTTPAGWLSPEQSESSRTPILIEEAGFEYVCDWPNDEQPYFFPTPGKLVSVPTSHFLDDVLVKDAYPERYTDQVAQALSTLSVDGDSSGRCLVLTVRPWITGQPFRIGAFERALSSVVESGQAWPATTGEIASAFRRTAGPTQG